jgi:predicted AAA+ superfamily ATPase
VLTGVRRCGKSTLQQQLLADLGTGVLVNFEDTRLFGLAATDFPLLLDLFEERWPTQPVFLDEVQEVPGWQRLVRTLLDRGRFVCVTGSNASLLGRELGSKLTGRHLSFEVRPFSFAEFLAFTGRSPDAAALLDWLDRGGFPGFLRAGDPRLLQELLRDVIQRDITTRHKVRTPRHHMHLALFLLANTGQPLSMNGLTRALAIPTVPQTTRAIDQMLDAYLFFAVPKWSPSFKKRVVSPAKYYAIDNGLRRANSPQTTPDVGHRLENAVYLGLRARGEPIHYAAETNLWECDFMTPTLAVQVCARLDDENRGREVRGALAASRLPGRRRPLLLTLDQTDRIAHDGVTIDVMPAWRWLLDTQQT